MPSKRIVHYINQFFAGVGGEDKAYTTPFAKNGPLGPGLAFQKHFGEAAQIVGTAVCGDNYFAENLDKAAAEILELIRPFDPEILIAGPAFNAGRYGPACGAICRKVVEELHIPAITGMYSENPGLELYRKHVYILETGPSVAAMSRALPLMANFALKLAEGKEVGPPEEENYFPRGYRKNLFSDQTASERAVQTLLAKLAGQPYVTEIPRMSVDKVPPSPSIRDVSNATIALITDGGIVPLGNPDRIEPATATRFGKYSVEGLEELSSKDFECIHYGFDNTFATMDPNCFLPVDVMRDLEKEHVISRLFPYVYTTSGCTTNISEAEKMGKAIAAELKKENMNGAILTSG